MQIKLTGEQLATVALSTIKAAIGTERYQYLSGAITGGQRLLAWHSNEGRTLSATEYRSACAKAVIQPNISDIQAEAGRQRSAGRRTIEPASFEADLEHWGQAEFLAFWDRVLESHASSVRFMPGWEYSSGCAFEYHRAAVYGLPRLTIDGAELAPELALHQLNVSLCRISEMHDPANPRDAPLARLYASIASRRRLINDLLLSSSCEEANRS